MVVRSKHLLLCVQPRFSAVNVTLPAFAAERRAAAPLLLGPGACYRSIPPACRALRSKSAARRCMLSIDGTDRRTDKRRDGRTHDRFIDLACSVCYVGSVNTVDRLQFKS